MQIILNRFINWQMFLNIINRKSKEGFHYFNSKQNIYEFEKDDSITYHYFMIGKGINKPVFNFDNAIRVDWDFFNMYPWKLYKKRNEVVLYKIASNMLTEEELLEIQEDAENVFKESKNKLFDFSNFFKLGSAEVPNHMETTRASKSLRLKFMLILILFGQIPFYVLLTSLGIFIPSLFMIIVFGLLLDFEEIVIKKWDLKMNEIHSIQT